MLLIIYCFLAALGEAAVIHCFNELTDKND
jgi:hypothetical protein